MYHAPTLCMCDRSGYAAVQHDLEHFSIPDTNLGDQSDERAVVYHSAVMHKLEICS